MSSLVERVAQVTTRIVVREATVVDVEVLSPRTYTPCCWTDEQVSLVAYHPSTGGPAGPWLDHLAPGSTVEVFGPRRAMNVPEPPAPLILVGDETSFALAAAITQDGGLVAAQLYEVADADEAAAVLSSLAITDAAAVERASENVHLDQIAGAVAQTVRSNADARLILTGRARTIAAVLRHLRDEDLQPPTTAKAHWDERRRGMD